MRIVEYVQSIRRVGWKFKTSFFGACLKAPFAAKQWTFQRILASGHAVVFAV